MKSDYYITNNIAVDRFCAVKLADLNYREGSNRTDDIGALWVAPISKAGCVFPLGLLAIYASTNGDPILLGNIEDGEVTWYEEGADTPGVESVRDALNRAAWTYTEYAGIVRESLGL